MKNLLRTATLGMIALGATLAPADDFVLRYTKDTNLSGFLSQTRLQLVHSIPNQSVHLVRDVHGRTYDQVVREIGKLDDKINLEPNGASPNVAGRSDKALNKNLKPLQDALSSGMEGQFYGATVPENFANQPAATLVRLPEARRYGLGAGIVAVVDTGVDSSHPFLRDSLVDGYDFIRDLPGKPTDWDDLTPEGQWLLNPSTTPIIGTQPYAVSNTIVPLVDSLTADPRLSSVTPIAYGHGTMVAGAIRLVAPNAKIMPLKAFDAHGYGTLYNILRALYYADANGAKVINLSLNSYVHSAELARATGYLYRRNVILVASSGNDGLKTSASFPASYAGVSGVASLSPDGVRSLFSNWGDRMVDVCAPGEGILLPYPGNRWAGGWGTSFSAPFVSGTAALMVGRKVNLTYPEFESALSKSKDLNDPALGAGRLDIEKVVSSVSPAKT